MSAGRCSRLVVTTAAALLLSLAAGPPVDAEPGPGSLGEIEIALLGLSAGVDPVEPIVPRETASGVRIVVTAGGRALSSAEVARLLGGPFEVRAELSGPGLPSALSLPLTGADAVPSPDPLVLTFPGLPTAGEYDLANVRLVRGGRPVLDVEPRRTTLRVIDQILVTSVVTRPLTLDEIRERGVVLDSSAYLGFEFAITLQLESKPIQLTMPVVFDREGVPVPVALQPPPEPLRSVVSAPQLVPILLRPRPAAEGPSTAGPPLYTFDDLGFTEGSIPSLLVIPGSVGYLKQFFSAQLAVGNGAPEGSGLVVRDVTGRLVLPPGDDGAAGTEDDPLALPALEGGPQSPLVDVLGEHGSSTLLPGEFGHAELTLRGEREGRHEIEFEIEAELDGLPVGPVPLEGQARGVVLVRNAYFDVTFTVPTVVRADEEFSLFATVTNIGQGTGQDVDVALDPARLSGAHLLSSGTQDIDRLDPGDSRTLEYRFRSQVTGEVVASYLRFDTNGGVDVTGQLNFTLGVGERGVALSPDTLVLPSSTRALPDDVVRAAMRVLGHAWSAAHATALPAGVDRPSTEAVFQKGVAVAEAGLRVELGQPLPHALRDLLLDFHGGLFDAGFDQALRDSAAGRDFDSIVAAFLQEVVAGEGLLYQESAAEMAASGPPFLSFAVESPGGGAWPAEVALEDATGSRTDLEVRGVPTSLLVALGPEAEAPRLGWVSSLTNPPYAIRIDGTDDGVVDLALTVPGDGGEARQVRVDGVTVQSGSRARVVWDPSSGDEIGVQVDLDGDGVYEQQSSLATTPLPSFGPQLVSAATIGPETLQGAHPFGTYAALLFDRVVSASDAADLSNYEIERNSVVAARRQLSGRLVFVGLEQPEGPLVPAEISIQGIRDERGVGGASQEQPLTSRLILPGAVVSGRVLEADGTPVADAQVVYHNVLSVAGLKRGVAVAALRTDESGRFELRYVSQESGGSPFRVETSDPTTGAVRGVKAYVRADGQRQVLDLVLVGHGTVTGVVRHADGRTAADAQVRVVSVTDSQIGVVTTADAQGAYEVEGMTVGAVAVTAVSGANLGRAAGRLDEAGGTTSVDVTLDGEVDFTGTVQKLEDGVLTPVPGIDVVYYREGVALGVSVTDSYGQYRLWGVPAGDYRLEAGLNTRDKTSLDGHSIAGQSLVKNLIIAIADDSTYGTVRGTVRRLDGSLVPNAWVSDNVATTLADAVGQYELVGVALSTSPRRISAVSPDGRREGSTNVLLSVSGQIVEGADIELSGLGAAVFQVLDTQGAPVEGASVGLQGSCLHPCGCRFADTDDQGLARFADMGFGTVRARAVVQDPSGRWDSALGTAEVTSEDVAGGGLIRMEGFGTVTVSVTNPDGTPAHGALVTLQALDFVNEPGVCSLRSRSREAYSDEGGAVLFEDVHVSSVSVQASSTVFPRNVGGSAHISSDGASAHIELKLIDTMAGVLSGTIWLPDSSAGAGPGVEVTVNGPVPDVTVHTLADGSFEFAPVLPTGSYWLTARDTRPDGTGSVARTRVYLQAEQDAHHELRLQARGPVHVTVVDGNNVPVEDAVVQVRVVESDFPNQRFEGTISGPGSQPLVFPDVFEGEFAVHVSDNFARGGRSNGTVPPDGQPAEVKVQLTTTGTVSGRFLWADGTTPLPFGSVRLVAGGRVIGQQTTASEGDVGSYLFDYVPAGAVRLEAEDPASGRTGLATGELTLQDELVRLDVVAHAVGRVEGEISLNGAPAPTAEVSLSSGRYRVEVTADADGRYVVDGVPAGVVSARAHLGGGFLAGTATGTLLEEGQVLDLPVALKGAGSIEGTLLAAGGAGPGAPSVVSLWAGGGHKTTTDEQGLFRFDLIPEGSVTLVAEALGSIDCARQSLSVAGGEAAQANLELLGVGAVEGTASSSAGPVSGTLTVKGTGPGCVVHWWRLSVGPSGQYRIPELLAGPVEASFETSSTTGPKLYASSTADVLPGQTTVLDLLVEPSGHVQGSVIHEDGSPAIGSEIRITASGGRRTTVHSGAGGAFFAEGVPVGLVTLSVTDAALGGVALVEGLTVPENATLAAGEIQLIETPLAVTDVVPTDGTVDVSIAEPLLITFNEPLAGTGGLSLTAAGQGIGFRSTLSADRLSVTVAPWSSWPDSRELVLEAGTRVTDVYGRRLPAAFTSCLRTVDLSPPSVLSVSPADGTIEVDPSTAVVVLFDEPLATGGDLQPIVQVDGPQGTVAGTVSAAASDTLRFTPSHALTGNATYSVTVNGATDLLGHVQTAAHTSSFMTPDTVVPALQLETPPPGGWTNQRRTTIRVTVSDALAGPETSAATMRLDGIDVPVGLGPQQFTHLPQADLSDGTHTVEASAHDRAGNRGDLLASFQVDGLPPSAAQVVTPTNDQVLMGEVLLSGAGTDPGSGVAALDFFRDGTWVAEALAENGLSTTWSSAGTADGPYLITARATDVAGNPGPMGASVPVIVNNVPLAISLTAPAEGFRARTEVAVAAAPSEPVSRVEFRAGSGPVVTDEAAPYEAVLDLTSEPEGEVTITVTAVGFAPETGTAARTLMVDRTPPSPPDPTRVNAEASDESTLVVGLAGSVELGSRVEVANSSRSVANQRMAFADGSFAMRIAGSVGEALAVTATDEAGNTSDPLALTIGEASTAEIPLEGLALWVRSGEGTTADGGEGVSRWSDGSGQGNDLVQTDLSFQPVLAEDPVSEMGVLHFDGSNDWMSFTTRLDGTVRAVFAVVSEDEDAWPQPRALLGTEDSSDFYGAQTNWWFYQPPYVSTSLSIVEGQTWVNGAVIEGRTTARPNTLSVVSIVPTDGVTAGRLCSGQYSAPWQGDVAELIVYTEPLTASDRKSVEDYLALKYAVYVATAGAPEFSPNGGSFEGSVEVTLSTPTPGAEIRYTLDGSEPTGTSEPYVGPFELTETTTVRARAFHPVMSQSPVTVGSFMEASDFSPTSVAGLALWVRSDSGLSSDALGRTERWEDQSGHGNDLVQLELGSQPIVHDATPSGLPALHFDGTDDWLSFAQRLDETVRAVFAVVSEDEDAWPQPRALLGTEDSSDFYGAQTNWWFYQPPYVSTSLSIVEGQTWVNGAVIEGRTTARPNTLSVVSIFPTDGVTAGRLCSGQYSAPWQGDVAELIVYTEPLTASDRKSVEDYLALKYAAYVATAGAPEFSPNGGSFEGSVEVSLSSPTPGAEIRYTLDGSEPTETSEPYSGPFELTEPTTAQARAFHPAMNPSPVTSASFAGEPDFSPSSLAGLALWVRADAGVTASEGLVSSWADQSGNGNDLAPASATGRPLLAAGQVNGLPVIRFDGASGADSDVLYFTERLTTIRTVFWVIRAEAGDTGPQFLLGDASKYDFHAGHQAQIWDSTWVNSAIKDGETWLNGEIVDGRVTDRPSTMSVISLVTTGPLTADAFSRDRAYSDRSWHGDLAELVIYDRPLSPVERESVENYLALKYAAYVPTAVAPEFSPNGGTFEGSVEVSLSTSTPGAEIRYTLDGSEPTETSEPYLGPFELMETTTVQARAFHPAMNFSPVSIANFVGSDGLSPAGVPDLALWVRADLGVVLDGASDRVIRWRDASGRGNDLTQTDPDAQPLLVPDAQAGRPALWFDGTDGTDDVLHFTERLTNVRTVFWAVRAEEGDTGYRHLLGDESTYHFHSGSGTQIWGGYASSAIRSGETRVNGQIVDGTSTSRPTTLSTVSLVTTGSATADALSRQGRYPGRSWRGDVAELIIYDRPLGDEERATVEHYLAIKHGLYVPSLDAPVFSPNGSTVSAPTRVAISATPGAAIHYTTDGSEPTEASPQYSAPFVVDTRTTVSARAFRAGFSPSPVSSAMFLDDQTPAPLRVAGLKLWVKADAGVTAPGGLVSSWADQSGNGNDLVQTTTTAQPFFVSGEVNGLPVLRFDGASGADGDVLHFTERLTTVRTVFWVVRAEEGDSGYRFLLGDASTYHFHSGGTAEIWSGGYSSTAIRNGTTRLNGEPVDGRYTDRPTSPSLVSLVTTGDVIADAFSRDRGISGRSWRGDLAELVIYDRPLSNDERTSVESYLAAKYALFVPTAAPPTINPPGGWVPETGAELVHLDSETAGAVIRFTIDDTEPTETSAVYAQPLEITGPVRIRARSFLSGWSPSLETVVTFLGQDEVTPASLSNLALWVRADAGVGSGGASWADQGPAGNSLTQTNPAMVPEIALEDATRMPALRLDGVDDALLFAQRLTTVRTVFWVIRAEEGSAGYSFLLGDSSTYDFCSGTGTQIWHGGYASASIRNGETRLNGEIVDGGTTDRPTSLSVISLVTTADVNADAFSRDRTYSGRSWSGALAELIIYDRALSPEEVTQVEDYLAVRYDIGVAP